MQENVRPLCHGCEHYYVTWDAAFPFGCKGFQMKSKRNPSLSVYFASGKRCMLFEKKRHRTSRKPNLPLYKATH